MDCFQHQSWVVPSTNYQNCCGVSVIVVAWFPCILCQERNIDFVSVYCLWSCALHLTHIWGITTATLHLYTTPDLLSKLKCLISKTILDSECLKLCSKVYGDHGIGSLYILFLPAIYLYRLYMLLRHSGGNRVRKMFSVGNEIKWTTYLTTTRLVWQTLLLNEGVASGKDHWGSHLWMVSSREITWHASNTNKMWHTFWTYQYWCVLIVLS